MSVLTFKSSEYKTFPMFLRDYAEYECFILGRSEKTICEYLLDLRTFFRYYKMKRDCLDTDMTVDEYAELPISDLTIDDAAKVTSETILSFLVFLGRSRENNPSTRLRKLSSLRSFYHYAYGRKHLVPSNPAADVEGPKKAHTLPKFLTLEESLSLLEAVWTDTGSKTRLRDYCMITLFLNTGMRLSELVGLDVTSFDTDITRVTVTGKGNKQRVVYLNDACRDSLVRYLSARLDPRHVRTESTALFLSGRDQRISGKTVQWVVYKYIKLAGLGGRGLSVHKLRHTAATLMYQSGEVDIRVLKEILGHEQLNTTQIYTHVVDQNIEDAMKKNPLSSLDPKHNSAFRQ